MEQKFCRACGMNLEAIAKAMGAQGYTPAEDDSRLAAKRRMMRWMRWSIVIMFAGMFIGIGGKKFMHNDIVTGAGTLITLAGMFLICFGSLTTMAPRKKRSPRQESPAQPAEQAKTTLPLPLELSPESINSVTESTTELLVAEPVKVSARPRD
jgi:uncharacterized membrane protein YidH (DUF202 family)